MTPATRYIASQYEKCVDSNLNVDAIRLHLAACGIRRTPGQVVHDLSETFGFHGYADSHPAPPVLTLAQIDKLFGY